MLARYQINAGFTYDGVLADIVAILTGTTDPNTLSASCDKPNTTINASQDPAGWILHDSVSASTKVIKALTADGLQTKYVELGTWVGANIYSRLWEGWNAGTHVGVNGSHFDAQGLSTLAAGQVLTIYSTARGYIILKGAGTRWTGCLEFPRENWPSSSVASGMLPAFCIAPHNGSESVGYGGGPYFYAHAARYYGRGGGLVTAGINNVYFGVWAPFGSGGGSIAYHILNTGGTTYLWRDANNQEVGMIFPLGASGMLSNASGFDSGDIGAMCNLLWVTSKAGGDTFTYNGKQFITHSPPGGHVNGGFAFGNG